jgi:hypothetical protein
MIHPTANLNTTQRNRKISTAGRHKAFRGTGSTAGGLLTRSACSRSGPTLISRRGRDINLSAVIRASVQQWVSSKRLGSGLGRDSHGGQQRGPGCVDRCTGDCTSNFSKGTSCAKQHDSALIENARSATAAVSPVRHYQSMAVALNF